VGVPKSTTSIRLPDDLIEALDERAAVLGVTRSQLIIAAVEQALEDRSSWSPGFLKAIGAPHPELEEVVDEMMQTIRKRRSRSEPREL
jgi:Ribbon-helix-helix protein, copG family